MIVDANGHQHIRTDVIKITIHTQCLPNPGNCDYNTLYYILPCLAI